MSRAAAPTGAKNRLMSEMKALRNEKWINFEDVSCVTTQQYPVASS
jgi:hypothetical protein